MRWTYCTGLEVSVANDVGILRYFKCDLLRNNYARASVRAYVCVCVCLCACVCMYVCVCAVSYTHLTLPTTVPV